MGKLDEKRKSISELHSQRKSNTGRRLTVLWYDHFRKKVEIATGLMTVLCTSNAYLNMFPSSNDKAGGG